MVNSVAVLSDVHGVLPVLEAVLTEPEVAAADLVVVTGDHAAGPQPVEVLQRLAALGDRAVLVRGNADRELVALARGQESTVGEPYEIDVWAAEQLTADQMATLAELPHPVTIDITGFGPVMFCHGTPRDDEEVVLVDTRLERWAEVFAELPDHVQTVVCGHTHMPYVRLVDRRLVLSSGSIGMPYGRPGGAWALLRDGAVTLRTTQPRHRRGSRAGRATVELPQSPRVGRVLPPRCVERRRGDCFFRPSRRPPPVDRRTWPSLCLALGAEVCR